MFRKVTQQVDEAIEVETSGEVVYNLRYAAMRAAGLADILNPYVETSQVHYRTPAPDRKKGDYIPRL